MAYICEICQKKSQAGRQHTHHAGVAGGQWKKRAPTTQRHFRPNLHWVTLRFAQGKLLADGRLLGGTMVRVRACTRCIKRVRFDAKTERLGERISRERSANIVTP